jgi:hypothetical protein
MRLIPVCLPLVLAPLIVAGQQAQPPATHDTQQTTAAKQTSSRKSHKATVHHRSRHHSRKAAAKKNDKIPVDVITGSGTRRVLLDKEEPGGQQSKAKPGQMKVEVINGSSTDTQYFSDRNDETVRNQPVVVGVQTSDTRFASGNKNPVVTGVTSSSTVDAKTASAGGQPVAKQVSPHPKRPAYEPDVH